MWRLHKLVKVLGGIAQIPFMIRAFARVASATERRDWNTIASILEEMHGRGLDSDDTHYQLGCAYSMLSKWSEAISEFETIKTDLPKARDNARRLFNYSLALSHVGRGSESLGILTSAATGNWPPTLRVKSEQLVEHLTDGKVPPPSVQ